jgi:hypothetical protein
MPRAGLLVGRLSKQPSPNLLMGALTILFLLFLGRSHIDWNITNFFGTFFWVLLNRSTSLDPKLQNQKHLFSLYYMGVKLLANHMG